MRINRAFLPLLLGVISVAVLGVASGHQTNPAQPSKGDLEIIVLDESGNRMAGASVAVPGYRSTTTSSGTCRFSLGPGRYSVLVNKSGYRGRRLTAGVRPGETTTAEVRLLKLTPARPPKK
jgi:uncharacterized membrane protein